MSQPTPVTSDGLVTKIILQGGAGDAPPLHARCLVHYTVKLASSGAVVLDSRTERSNSREPALVVAGRTSALRNTGLNLGVATMRKGEHCRLHVAPQYGYGDKGNFSFPAVPPNADLEIDVQLVDWEPADDERPRGEMMYEERLEAAERRRLEGNALFKARDHAAAKTKYMLALSFLDEDFLMQLEGPHLEKANDTRLPLYLNLAACDLQSEQWREALEHCEEVLSSQPDNSKALFRRGRAQLQLGNTDAAEQDLERAARLAPQDAAILREVMVVRRTRKQEREAEKELFKGRLFKRSNTASQVLMPSDSMWQRILAFLRAVLSFVFPPALWQGHSHSKIRT